jgi:hypothetical protein
MIGTLVPGVEEVLIIDESRSDTSAEFASGAQDLRLHNSRTSPLSVPVLAGQDRT